MTRIGIYGGTFSPPHNGHLMAARAFMEQMWLDLLYVIPTALPPHKEMEAPISAEHRLAMCRAAFGGMEGVIVSDCELRRQGKSYTVDTLREFYDPENRLFLLCGTDMMLTLDTWYQAEEIFKLCYPIYIRREDDPILTKRIIAKIAEYQQKYGAIVRRVVMDPIVLSSTQIRKSVAEGRAIDGMVSPAVAEYICTHELYR